MLGVESGLVANKARVLFTILSHDLCYCVFLSTLSLFMPLDDDKTKPASLKINLPYALFPVRFWR